MRKIWNSIAAIGVIVGLFASCIAIWAFATGISTIDGLFQKLNTLPVTETIPSPSTEFGEANATLYPTQLADSPTIAATTAVSTTSPTSSVPQNTPTIADTNTLIPSIVPTVTPIPPSPTSPPTSTRIPSIAPTNASSFGWNLSNWTAKGDGGSWNEANEGIVGTVAEHTDAFYVMSDLYTDFSYEITFSMSSSYPTAAAGVIFRSQSDPLQGCYMARVSIFNGGEISLVKFYPYRRFTQLALKNLSINLNSLYTIRIVASGENISVYLNGDHVLQAQDASYRSGAVGLNVNSSTARFVSAIINTS